MDPEADTVVLVVVVLARLVSVTTPDELESVSPVVVSPAVVNWRHVQTTL